MWDSFLAVTLTYVLYIVAELPSNLMLRKVGPKILLPGLCVCWGIVTTLQCLVKTYHGLLVARLFLGLAEGGLFPGINLYLSMFYKRDELQLRIAMFYSGAALSGAFSGLLAAAISKMNGIGGLTGWQWIFCLEGLFTVVFGVFAFWAMPNSPRQVQTFTEEQAKRSEERLQLEATFPASEKITLAGVLSVYQSLHLWLMFVIMFCGGVTVFGLAFFMPSIVLGFGYNPIQTQLMTVPPFAVAFVITLLTAYIADRYRKRGTAALVTMLLGLIGVIMFYRGRTNRVRYTALFFLVTGTYANVPCLLAWVPNNTAAHTRRAVAIATAFCCTNSGGIVSTWIFPTSDAPYYPFASKFILAMIVITLVAVVAEMAVLNRRNKQKDDPEYRERLLRDVQHLDFPQQMVKLGDAHPDYKYII